MLSFLTEILSQFLGKLRIFSEHMTAAMRKSKSTNEDVLKMRKIQIRNSLIEQTTDLNRAVSAINAPQRDALIVKQIISSSRHHEGTPLWVSQAPKQGRRKRIIKNIVRRKERARSLWTGR